MDKIRLDKNVLDAAKERISWVFDSFRRVYLSGPSGKDSGVMMHLACAEARRRGRRIGVLYVDLEAQFECTIDYIKEMFASYADCIDPHWVALPIHLRNAVSVVQPYWTSWDPTMTESWVRTPPDFAVTDPDVYPFYRPPWTDGDRKCAMEFEDFVPEFGKWYSGGEPCACLVGIRTDESLNRWRTIAKIRKSRVEGLHWTTWKGEGLVNCYPIYDWKTEDIWTFHGKTGLPHNTLYDSMHRAGLPIHQQRICQPYGDDQRRGLRMWHVVEPNTWHRVLARVAGANYGALYAGKRGNILGNGKVTLPDSHPTWESYVSFLLETLPEEERDHYSDKIAVFIAHWRGKGVEMVDEADPKLEAQRKAPSWRRVAKKILLNDRMCRRLSFSQQSNKDGAYQRYRKIMRKRRAKWGL